LDNVLLAASTKIFFNARPGPLDRPEARSPAGAAALFSPGRLRVRYSRAERIRPVVGDRRGRDIDLPRVVYGLPVLSPPACALDLAVSMETAALFCPGVQSGHGHNNQKTDLQAAQRMD
jgi:hypothetical protein